MGFLSTITALSSAAMLLLQAQGIEARGPIIGIHAHPVSKSGDYIAASYVKWVEMGGGRVVPIPYDASPEYLKRLVPQLNGLLLPGGAADVNDAAKTMYKLALELNDQGVHYPLWGTCLGFEWLLQITADDLDALDNGFHSENVTLPLNFTDMARSSRLFSGADDEVYSWMATKPITMNNHNQGITPERFAKFDKLPVFYDVLATNFDVGTNREFISAIEAKKYPVYALQFHPEKNSFEYGEYPDGSPFEVVDHSYEAIRMGQYFANFFVNEARKNDLKFDDPHVERDALIYNYQTSTFTDPGFVESYMFRKDPQYSFWRVTQ